MNFTFDEREGESPYIDMIWHTQSDYDGTFTSVAVSHWELVVTLTQARITVTVRGPETKPTSANAIPDAEIFGIIFKHGVYMPHLPTKKLVDDALNLPRAASRSFWLGSIAWEIPTYDNADTFVDQLMREGLLVQDEVVAGALNNQPQSLSQRSIQRRFLHVTGLTQGSILQIERARKSMTLLQRGYSIADVVHQMSYADQPHLTRSLKRYLDETPAQIAHKSETG